MKISKTVLFLGASFAFQWCAKSRFASRKSEQPATTGASPNEGDATANRICSNSHKASRIAIVVDNSESHGVSSGAVQTPNAGMGSDPVYALPSPRNRVEPLTNRQSALYKTILYTHQLDAKAVASNPQFMGTDIGVAYFPLSNDYVGLSKYKMVSGSGLLAQPMTNMTKVQMANGGSDLLWDTLAFTHRPLGMTPYTTGLTAAYDLLKANRDPNDPRPDILIFITDGLPTDERPKKVLEAKARLGNTRVIVISVLKPGTDVTSNNSAAMMSLKRAFEDDQPAFQWARKPYDTDGYQITEFKRYWNDLLALPRAISDTDRYIEIIGSGNIDKELDDVLQSERRCR